MLNKSCLCCGWRGGWVIWPVFGGTRNIIHSDYKLLQNTLIVFAKYWWVLIEFSKNSRRLRPCIPCVPCSLFPFTMVCRYDITAIKRMNLWESTFLFLTKCDPQFFYKKKPRSCSINRTLTEMTRPSVSLALFIIVLLPSAAVCFECRNICVSALSWLQWVSPSRLIEWLQTTPSSWVTITVLLVLGHIFTILSARKLYSSVVLLLSLKKMCQFSSFQSLCV
jgi:hypothetical protein